MGTIDVLESILEVVERDGLSAASGETVALRPHQRLIGPRSWTAAKPALLSTRAAVPLRFPLRQ